jgi:hypothetical protein
LNQEARKKPGRIELAGRKRDRIEADERYGIQSPGRCGTGFITTTTPLIRHTLLFPVGLTATIRSFVASIARIRI